jgi:hypothetical protein
MEDAMARSVLAGLLGLLACAGVGAPASAGGLCDCYDVIYVPKVYDYEPRVMAYYADPRELHRRFHPRGHYAAAHDGPPSPPRVYGHRPYGYAYVARGPVVLVHPYPRHRSWRHRR